MKKEERNEILKYEITSEGNNALASVKINCNTEKKNRTGIEVIADIKSEARLKAFTKIRYQIACVSSLRVDYTILHSG